MLKISGAMLKLAALKAGLRHVVCEPCPECNVIKNFEIIEGDLYLDISCECIGDRTPIRKAWQDIADWINEKKPGLGKDIVLKNFSVKKAMMNDE